jgi:hypothetical protein
MVDLDSMKKEILANLQEKGFNIFYASELEQENEEFSRLNEIRWSDENRNWREFLNVAKHEGIKTIILECPKLDEIQLSEIPGAESFKKYVGKTCFLSMSWIKDQIKYTFYEASDWWNELSGLIEEGEELNEPQMEEYARKLAQDPRFPHCKNDTQREYLLKSVAPEAFKREDVGIPGVISKAGAIFEIDIRGKLESDLASKIRELRNQGKSQDEIAKTLGISRDAVRKHLGGI